MKIVSLNTSVSRRNGGVFEASRRLAQELDRIEPGSVEVLGVRDESFNADAESWTPLKPRVFDPAFPRAYGYAPGLGRRLGKIDPDVCHVHGLWAYPTLAARRWSRRTGRPYVVTVHGMLDRWALRNSGWKKSILGALTERRNLASAACLHAITPAEVADLRSYGLSNPICLIPNGVDLPKEREPCSDPPPWPVSDTDEKVLLYLGRIHPKKGLLPLVEAWALLMGVPGGLARKWRLVIAGWDQGGHETELRTRVKASGLEHRVHFAGPLFGGAKTAAYRNADAFVLPSFSEGLPLVVLEAWAHRLPVLMTDACNLDQGFVEGAALRVEPHAESIAKGIEILQRWPGERLKAMGGAGRSLVERDFGWPRLAAEMRRVYEWLKDGKRRPESVST